MPKAVLNAETKAGFGQFGQYLRVFICTAIKHSRFRRGDLYR